MAPETYDPNEARARAVRGMQVAEEVGTMVRSMGAIGGTEHLGPPEMHRFRVDASNTPMGWICLKVEFWVREK